VAAEAQTETFQVSEPATSGMIVLWRNAVRRAFLILAGLLVVPGVGRGAAEKFRLKDGDRVVLLGNTLIERAQRYGYWETDLTRRWPHKKIVFRNLGWSGDTVFGHARAGFGTVADGFRQLKEHVIANKPTVIVIGYGLNESFKGKAGLPHFREGLDVLLDTLAPTKARVVLLSPLRQENLGRPLPDPTEQNQNIRLYCKILKEVADKRGYLFVDLFTLLGDKGKQALPLTDNGIHLTASGYWRSTAALEKGLGLEPLHWQVEIDNTKSTARGAQVIKNPAGAWCFRIIDHALPQPPPPSDGRVRISAKGTNRVLRVRGLTSGRYALKIDGKSITAASAADWAAGVRLTHGPEFDQAERLRKAIVAKNRLYFYRWRPQNETYLFGFRKHEQGKNAKEVVQFDPLIARAEAEIAKLRVPQPHTYEFVPVTEKGK
jgi:lysophospholipase L1-like esterase